MKISFKSAVVSAFLVFFLYGCSNLDFQSQEEELSDEGNIFVADEDFVEQDELQDMEEGLVDEEGAEIVVTDSQALEEPETSFFAPVSSFFGSIFRPEAKNPYVEDERQPYLVLDVPNFYKNADKENEEELTNEQIIENKAYSMLKSEESPRIKSYRSYNQLDESHREEVDSFINKYINSEEFNAVVIAIPINPYAHGINKEDGGLTNYQRYLMYTHYVKKYLYKTAKMTMKVFMVEAQIPADKVFITFVKYDSENEVFKNIGKNIYTVPNITAEDWLEKVEELEKQQQEMEKEQDLSNPLLDSQMLDQGLLEQEGTEAEATPSNQEQQ